MAEQTPVHFFDIDSTLPGSERSWSPNTLKTRMVLNYKGIPYTQTFISYPDIAPLLSHMAVPPHPDQTSPAPYTLPAICHPSVTWNSAGVLMDSLPIAVHLEETFPSTPTIFPSGAASHALAIAIHKLMMNVAAAGYNIIISGVAPFLDHRGQEYFRRTRSARVGKPFDEICPTDPKVIQVMTANMKREMIPVAEMLRGRSGKPGPFLEGDKPSYADLILVSFLVWLEKANKSLHEEIMGVGDGELKQLWDVCLPWVNGQGEEKDWVIPQ